MMDALRFTSLVEWLCLRRVCVLVAAVAVVGWLPGADARGEVAGLRSAVATLVEQGLPSPAGLEYRGATVRVYSSAFFSGDHQEVETHIWLLPAREGEADDGRHGLAWNGLVYPLLHVGPAASVEEDVRALVDAPEPHGFSAGGGYAFSEAAGVSTRTLLPMKAALLHLLGRGDLVDRVVVALPESTWATMEGDGYLRLADDWAWTMFDRGIGSHAGGSDAQALADFTRLSEIAPLIDAEAERRGFERPRNHRSEPGPYLRYLEQLPTLVADQRQRVNEPSGETARPAGRGAYADDAAWAEALAADLKQVNEWQNGQPGSVVFAWHPTVQALIDVGEPALPALLRTLEQPNRRTRSVGFHRNFFRDRVVLSVHAAARVAANGILDQQSLGGSTGREAAEEIRGYWESTKGMTREQRWYWTLVHDDDPTRVVQAAENIVRPANVRRLPSGGSIRITTSQPPDDPDAVIPMRGQSLRGERDPTVTEAMLRRIEGFKGEIPRPDRGAFADDDAYERAVDHRYWQERMRVKHLSAMLGHLSRWDPRVAEPLLAERFRELASGFKLQSFGGYASQEVDALLAVAEAWIDVAPDDALGAYGRWLLRLNPDGLGQQLDAVCRLAAEHADHPAMVDFAEAAFADDGRWSRAVRGGELDEGLLGDLIHSPLIDMPAFRGWLIAGLRDLTEAGSHTVDAPRERAVEGGDDRLPEGTAYTLRTCEVFARFLSSSSRRPRFSLDWPRPARDEAIAELIEYVERMDDAADADP